MAPLGPFTLTVWPSILAVTPTGMATAFFPTRDMALIRLHHFNFTAFTLEYRAEDFSADIGVAGVVVGHHALGRGTDSDAKAVIDARQRLHRGIDATAGLRHAGNFPDYRLAVEIFQLDLELRLSVRMLHRGIAADEALALEDVEHVHAQPG